MSSSDEDYEEESSERESSDKEEDGEDDVDDGGVGKRKVGKDLSNQRVAASKKGAPKKKRKGRSLSRAKRVDDDDGGGSLQGLLVMDEVEGEKPMSATTEEIFTKYSSYIVDEKGEPPAVAKKVLRHLVEKGLVIGDYDFGEDVEEVVFSPMVKSGLLTTKHAPMNQSHRSAWFGSAFRNVPHNLKILRQSSTCMSFLQQVLANTGGIVCKFFAQYYLPSTNSNVIDKHGHFGFHQDTFVANQYRLLVTLGDSKEGKKMTFSICDKIPSDETPGERVTLSIPHGRAVLLNRYVSVFT